MRLGLAGGASDVAPYCDLYGGHVLNATINMFSHCHLEPGQGGLVEFHSLDSGETFTGTAVNRLALDGDLRLHKAVYNRIVSDFCSAQPPSVRLWTHSDAPTGAGLGSSSTLVVAMLRAYMEWLKFPLGDYDLAQLAYQIERVDAGLPGGRQDQYAATFGGFNFMEFYVDNRVVVNPLRVRHSIVSELESCLLLYFTGVTHASSHIIEEQIANIRNRDSWSIEATHELKRDAVLMKESLLRGNIREVAHVLGRSWEAKKSLAAGITTTTIDQAYTSAIQAGAWAGKVSGAGGGGFVIFMMDPLMKYAVRQALQKCGGTVYPFQFVEHGAYAWSV